MGLLSWLFGSFSEGKGKTELLSILQIDEDTLNTPIEYSNAFIPKSNGGQRKLLIPSQQLKTLQRTILKKLFTSLKSHPAAKGFASGESIVTNAKAHVGKKLIIKLDIKNFFENTSEENIFTYFQKIGWNKEVSSILTKICTYEGGLPQGAPTSPRLSNLINFKLDKRLTGLARQAGFVYTRYADDITFSSEQDKAKYGRYLIQQSRKILLEYGYIINKRKINICRQNVRQIVTGLVVNKKCQLPRETRRWLRAVEHRIKNGQTPTISENEYKGWISLQKMIEKQSSI